MPDNRTPFDIMPLHASALYTHYGKSNVEVEYFRGTDEDMLSSKSLIDSGKVWEYAWNMKCRQSDTLKWSQLYIADRIQFMLWARANCYGSVYKHYITDNEYVEVDTSEVQFSKLDMSGCDEDGLFPFTIQSSGTELKYRLLNAGEIEESNKAADNKQKLYKTPYSPKKNERLQRAIMEVDGVRDKQAVKEFLEGFDYRPGETNDLLSDMNKRTPSPDLMYTGISNYGKEHKFIIDLSGSFFFPGLYV